VTCILTEAVVLGQPMYQVPVAQLPRMSLRGMLESTLRFFNDLAKITGL
jgi:hypothetical protein